MPVSPPASESALLTVIIAVCQILAVASVAVWCGVFAVRVRRLRRDRREAAAERELTALVLDHTVRPPADRDPAAFTRLPPWQRRIVLGVLRGLIEQTRGRDQKLLVTMLSEAGFREQAAHDLQHGRSLQRLQACAVLGFFSDEAALAALRNALGDRDAAVRLAAARALLTQDGLPTLRELLQKLDLSREDPPLMLADLFAQLPARLLPEAVELLGDPLPPEWLRMLAIALGRRQVPEAFPALAILRTSPFPRVRAAAWVGFAELGDPRAGDLVAEGLADPSPSVRSAACDCAGQLGGPEILPALMGLLADPDWEIAWRAAQALLKSGARGRQLLEEHSRTAADGDAGRQAWAEAVAEETHAA